MATKKASNQGRFPHKSSQVVHSKVTVIGPLPPPEVLAKYDSVTPGLAERIIKMAEKQSDHRRNLEVGHLQEQKKINSRIYREATLGQFFAFLIATIAIIGGLYVAIHGAQWTGSIIGGTALASIVVAFIQGRKKH